MEAIPESPAKLEQRAGEKLLDSIQSMELKSNEPISNGGPEAPLVSQRMTSPFGAEALYVSRKDPVPILKMPDSTGMRSDELSINRSADESRNHYIG